jgi:hypothetical protein
MKPKTAQGSKPTKSMNVTHKNTIHNENIKKENKYAGKNLMENYQLNPNSSSKFENIYRDSNCF